MRQMVEFCISRLTPDVEAIKEELEDDPDVDVLETSCLSHCEVCAQTPYALVNGEVVTGKTGEELGINIRKAIKDYQKRMDDLFDLL